MKRQNNHSFYFETFIFQVYDIAFSRAGGGRDMFASVGADGSVRMFDLRYESHQNFCYQFSIVNYNILFA